MKKIALSFLALLIMSSCGKETALAPSVDLGFQTVNEGELHNRIVDYLITDLDPNISEEDLLNFIQSQIVQISGIIAKSENLDPFLVTNVLQTELSLDMISSSLAIDHSKISSISSDLQNTITGFSEFILAQGNSAVAELKSVSLDYLESSQLSASDEILFESMIDVFINSALFWLPETQGGLGKLKQLQSENPTFGSRASIFGILLADAAGIVGGAAASVAATGGASAIPNPVLGGLPTASVVGVVVGATASVSKAIDF